ncbi:MAG: hypothetical protein L0G59_13225, partial [Kocuria sp.]|nr:hypothetical protein [Kocuria sp.]
SMPPVIGGERGQQFVSALLVQGVADGATPTRHQLFIGQTEFTQGLKLMGNADLSGLYGIDDFPAKFRSLLKLADYRNTQGVAEQLHSGEHIIRLVMDSFHVGHPVIIANFLYINYSAINQACMVIVVKLTINMEARDMEEVTRDHAQH